jgi:phage replication O-like protein O
MKNPWKRLSKINPQREDGTRQINNQVLDALIRAKLPTAEMGVVLTVISKTWGFRKNSDTISTSQFVAATGFPARTIKRVRQELSKKRIICFRESKRVIRGTPLNEYMFNKHYDTWKTQDTKKGVIDSTGVIHGKKRVSPATPTKETITKEREIYTYLSRELCDFVVGFIKYISEKKANLAPKSDGLEKKSADAVDKLIRIDGFDLDYIRTVIRWALKDNFWGDKIFSLASLRKKNDDGITKFQNIANKYETQKNSQARPVNGSGKPSRSEENAQACDECYKEMMKECGYHE